MGTRNRNEPEYLGDALWVTMDAKGTVRVFEDKKHGNELFMTSVAVCALVTYCLRKEK